MKDSTVFWETTAKLKEELNKLRNIRMSGISVPETDVERAIVKELLFRSCNTIFY